MFVVNVTLNQEINFTLKKHNNKKKNNLLTCAEKEFSARRALFLGLQIPSLPLISITLLLLSSPNPPSKLYARATQRTFHFAVK